MNRNLRSGITQAVAIIFAFVGAMVLVGTFVPLLNPAIWKDVVHNAEYGGTGGWPIARYVVWYSGGIGISMILLMCAWLLNVAKNNKRSKNTPKDDYSDIGKSGT